MQVELFWGIWSGWVYQGDSSCKGGVGCRIESWLQTCVVGILFRVLAHHEQGSLGVSHMPASGATQCHQAPACSSFPELKIHSCLLPVMLEHNYLFRCGMSFGIVHI